jgi:hypothetical protein
MKDNWGVPSGFDFGEMLKLTDLEQKCPIFTGRWLLNSVSDFKMNVRCWNSLET